MKPLELEQETPVIQKTKELCSTILSQPGYEEIKDSITTFLENDEARGMYEELCDKQEELSGKQQAGAPVTAEEEAAFAEMENKFVSMPIAANFIKAQQDMDKMEKAVSSYVRKTFELGRVPTNDDFQSGGCGSGCGCS